MTDSQVANLAQKQVAEIKQKLESSQIPQDLKAKVISRLDQLINLASLSSFLPEIDRMGKYVDWVTQIPWEKRSQDILDVSHAQEILDKHHYGLTQIKERIIEFISIMSIKKDRGESQDIFRAPILFFVGLVGTGKTTISRSISEALGRKFARIPFGGMGSPNDLRGQPRAKADAEPGKVIKALVGSQVKNPVILLDEIDRVTDEGRASIMGVLVELLDPEQNHAFVDHYIDHPVDLSEIIFIATANNTRNISTAVMDRLEPISMPSYSDSEKIAIAKSYMFPKVLKAAGLSTDDVYIADETWSKITRPLGYDAGIRTLERTVEGVVRKIARLMVEGKGQHFEITPDNVKQFLPQY